MTRREDPNGDRAMPPPADPWATIDRPAPTVYLGDPGRTVNLGASNQTVNLGAPDQTVHLGPSHRTVRLPRPDPTAQVPPTAPTVHESASAPTVRAHEELRFGPGVPPTPVTAPAWPSTTAPRRPLLRRLVSALSGLLTLALVVVLGLYLWQRLSPLEVESAAVAVPTPAGNKCDVTVDVVATVRTNGRSGEIRYQWLRSGTPPGAVLTEQVGSGQRTAALTLKWTFSGVGTTTETATVNIIEPSPLQAGTEVVYSCQPG
ncbi:hypothetical protein [Paractinoplanes rishiriensis]|uniref:Uncharacterized protein n=1 Tax=Paractinoplanes rishiriensis TaxID=1050105 RepID=A0A919MWD0_9ACTN|nr:hypothetical protein [Actinoplanes rishiriensis]GIE97718.1 hypothetical protein Ari01nite_51830 [Actinoplanes rishiriensis]